MAKNVRDWLISNWITIIIIIAQAGFVYGTMRQNMATQEDRIGKIEKLELDRVKWVVEDQQRKIDGLQGDQRQMQQSVADIKAQIGVINSKLDTIIENLRNATKRNP